MSRTFNIVLLGDKKCGKSAYMERLTTGDFTGEYHPTPEGSSYTLRLASNHGEIVFVVHEMAGKDVSDLCCAAHGAIIMFDLTDKGSYHNVPQWKELLDRTHPNIPLVLCGTKIDVTARAVSPENIHYHRDWDCQYYDISAKSNYNFEKPFATLARALTGHADFSFF